MLPASFHDLTPIYELSDCLPSASALLGDKGDNDALAENLLQQAGVCLLAIRRKNMKAQHSLADEWLIACHRRPIETVNSQLESMGINRLRARTNNGFFLKI